MKEVEVLFGIEPSEKYIIVAIYPLNVDSSWKNPHFHKTGECDPTPFKELALRYYPECTHVFAIPHGEMKCACGFDNVFVTYFCKLT